MKEISFRVMLNLPRIINNLVKKLLDFFCYWTNSSHNFSKTKKKFKVLYKSVNFLVVYKDFDVFTNNEIIGKPSLHSEIASEYPHLVNENLRHLFYFPHRLDYATSGVICVALNKNACAVASNSFQNRKTLKFYLAVLRGHVSKDFIDVRIPIGEDSSMKDNHKMCTSKNDNCILVKPSRTLILVLERGLFLNYPATKVLVRPISGRRHQIRVHCSSLGHTIVGDYTYSNRKDIEPNRTYLHAFRLLLHNPLEPIDILTEDPFSSFKLKSRWIGVETTNVISDTVFLKLTENCDINNKLLIS